MEQNDTYKTVQSKIKWLEQQLSQCDATIEQCDQSGKEAEKNIEEHFGKCINALAERKAVLLKEASQQVTNQKKMVEDTRGKLATSIEACKQTLKVSSITYAVSPISAEGTWKSLLSIPDLKVSSVRVSTRLSMTLFNDIQKHGEVSIGDPNEIQEHVEVMDTNSFSQAAMVTTFAGSLQGQKDGKELDACFDNPYGICMNPNDQCLYICDYSNSSIRKLNIQGDVTTFVEKNQVKTPFGIVMNHKMNCFYVTTNIGHTIVKISASGSISHFAGTGQRGSSDGVGSNASFKNPLGITIDQRTGNLFISSQGDHLIRKITPQGEVTTISGSQQGFADGNNRSAKFNIPYGIFFDQDSESLLVCDYGNNKLRRVQLNGDVSTLCEIKRPAFVVITANRTILVSTGANTLHRVVQQGAQMYDAELVAGSGRAARVDGRPDECCFYDPQGMAVHEASHSCFVADLNNHAIRRVSFVNPT